MIILQSTDKLQILLGGTPTVEATWYAAHADHTATTFTPNLSSGVTTGATAVDVVDSPAASTQRQVKYVSIYNGDAATITVTARVSHNGTFRTLAVTALAAGERMEYTDGVGWRTGQSVNNHNHDASNITTGTLAASRGGTGIGSYTAGNYVNALNSTTLQQRTPAQVLSDIGAAASTHNHDADYVNVTGDTMTGDLTITKVSATAVVDSTSGASNLIINAPGTSSSVTWYHRGSTSASGKRWATGNTGANSDFFIERYDDSGSPVALAFTITRSTGYVTIPGVYANTTASAANVFVNSTGVLFRSTSSEKYKKNKKPVKQEESALIYQMKPMTYQSSGESDNPDWTWYGLSAEELAAIEPRLVHWKTYETKSIIEQDSGGNDVLRQEVVPVDPPEPEGVMYDRITVLLLDQVQRQKAIIDGLVSDVAALKKATKK